MSYNKSGNFKQKLLMSLSLIAILLMLTGCLDYKAYELDGKQEAAPSEADLVKEIASAYIRENASNSAQMESVLSGSLKKNHENKHSKTQNYFL